MTANAAAADSAERLRRAEEKAVARWRPGQRWYHPLIARTVITAFTVFLTALALFLWGGDVLHDFSFAMLVGVVFGTYSSVYVASALALDTWIGLDRRKGIQAE